MLGIVILNYNSFEHLYNLLKELKEIANTWPVVVVDNRSEEAGFQRLKEFIHSECSSVNLLRNPNNLGYFKGNLEGVKFLKEQFSCTHALILNPDVGSDDWRGVISTGMEHFQKDIFIAGPRIVIPSFTDVSSPILRFTTLSEAFFNFAFPLSYILRRYLIARKSRRSQYVFAVEGSAYFIDVKKMIAIQDYFKDIFLYGEEIIYGKVAERNSWKIYYDYNIVIKHFHPPRMTGSSYESFYYESIKKMLKMFDANPIGEALLLFSFRYKMFIRSIVSKFL